ncbi:Wall-associated receptor kinase-like 20 [Bienertia sinuspersici]
MDGSVRANPQEGDLDYQQVPFGFRLQPMQPNLQDRIEAIKARFWPVEASKHRGNTYDNLCSGNFGYLDPQYYRNMQLTDKSDVYSFGVVLLELLTSQKAIDFNREVEAVSLAAYIRKLVKTEKLMDAVDPVLKKGASKSVLETMKTLGNLAITCLDDERHNRPSIREVTEDIEYMLHIIEIPGSKA